MTIIIKPEICDILVPTNNYRNQWFCEENREKEENNFIKLKIAKQNKTKKISEENNKIIQDFIDSFIKLNNREPLETEIINNLKDKMDILIIKKNLENVHFFNKKNSLSNDEKV